MRRKTKYWQELWKKASGTVKFRFNFEKCVENKLKVHFFILYTYRLTSLDVVINALSSWH
jgi:hypothetical protein